MIYVTNDPGDDSGIVLGGGRDESLVLNALFLVVFVSCSWLLSVLTAGLTLGTCSAMYWKICSVLSLSSGFVPLNTAVSNIIALLISVLHLSSVTPRNRFRMDSLE